jgi:hypothetical protein
VDQEAGTGREDDYDPHTARAGDARTAGDDTAGDDEVTAAAQNILIRAQRDDWPEKPFVPTRRILALQSPLSFGR